MGSSRPALVSEGANPGGGAAPTHPPRGRDLAAGREREEVTVLMLPGVSIDIPVGTAFQYRCTGAEALRFLCISMPPWPGDAEATQIEGPWVPTAPVGPVSGL